MHKSSFEILPQPFAWIVIPAGKVHVISIISHEGRENYIPKGTSQIFDIPTFEIAKYPVTNAQFATFIEARGYNLAAGADMSREEKEQDCWTEPLYWRDSKWNNPDYPVVGVSLYEAIAFCQWVGELTEERISLPTEQQWQRAAQGGTDRSFAWGNEHWEDRCNWDTEGTTPVTQYEGKGDSAFGVVDMTGNVWEWCLTKKSTGENDLYGTDERIVRGGAWAMLYSHELTMTTTDRLSIPPSHRRSDIGFRLIRF